VVGYIRWVDHLGLLHLADGVAQQSLRLVEGVRELAALCTALDYNGPDYLIRPHQLSYTRSPVLSPIKCPIRGGQSSLAHALCPPSPNHLHTARIPDYAVPVLDSPDPHLVARSRALPCPRVSRTPSAVRPPP